MRRFGVSTHLFHGERLQPEHLARSPRTASRRWRCSPREPTSTITIPRRSVALAAWLRDAGLELPSVHAPIVDSLVNDTWGRALSTATRDSDARQATIAKWRRRSSIARAYPVHASSSSIWACPHAQNPDPDDNNRDAAIRSIEEIHQMAEPLGVTLALEVMGNTLSTAAALVDLHRTRARRHRIGICMDVGHAHLLGDTAEAIETASGISHDHASSRQSAPARRPSRAVRGRHRLGRRPHGLRKDRLRWSVDVRGEEPGDAAAVLERCVRARQKLESFWKLGNCS